MVLTNRLIIIDKDKSTGYSRSSNNNTYSTGTALTGLGGSTIPLRFKAGESTRLFNIFGYPNVEKKETLPLIEIAEVLNSGYDVWACGCPSNGKINVIYDTNYGIFKKLGTIDISSSTLENLNSSDEEDKEKVDGINNFSSDSIEVEIPLLDLINYFDNTESEKTNIKYVSGKGLTANLGFEFGGKYSDDVDKTKKRFAFGFGYPNVEGKVWSDFNSTKASKRDLGEDINIIVKYKGKIKGTLNLYENTFTDETTYSTDPMILGGVKDGVAYIEETANQIFISEEKLATILGIDKNKVSSIVEDLSLSYKFSLKTDTIHCSYIPKYLNGNNTISLKFNKYNTSYINKRTLTIKSNYANSVFSKSYTFSYDPAEIKQYTTDTTYYIYNILGEQDFITPCRIKKYDESESMVSKESSEYGFTETEFTLTENDPWISYINNNSSSLQDIYIFVDFDTHKAIYSDEGVSNLQNMSETFTKLADTYKLACMFMFNGNYSSSDIKKYGAVSQLSYGSNYICYSNRLKKENTKYGGEYYSNCLGEIAIKYMDCLTSTYYGGLAISGLNDSEGYGGQLSSSYKRLEYFYNEDTQDLLNNANVNCIIDDSTYKSFIMGSYTCQGGEDRTDSGRAHIVGAIKLCEREIREQVMLPQLDKLNNSYYRKLRAEQTYSILQKRIGNIWESGNVDTSEEVNTEEERALGHFNIVVGIKPTEISEYVYLYFTNYAQTDTVTSQVVY